MFLHVLPVVFANGNVGDLLHKIVEVVQAGDEHGSVFAAVQKRHVLPGAAESDGPLEMNQCDPAPIENGRQSFVADADADP